VGRYVAGFVEKHVAGFVLRFDLENVLGQVAEFVAG
jgi:hypothetical protein